MMDVIYIASTLAFFALMIGYVGACDQLGQASDTQHEASDTWQANTEPRA